MYFLFIRVDTIEISLGILSKSGGFKWLLKSTVGTFIYEFVWKNNFFTRLFFSLPKTSSSTAELFSFLSSMFVSLCIDYCVVWRYN